MNSSNLRNLYDPLNLLSFRLFDDEYNAKQIKSAHEVKNWLECLNTDDLQEESTKFFQWIVVHNVDSHVYYAQEVLNYFHSKGLLTKKKSVRTLSKQDKSRYLVIYDMNGKVFSKVYNSVREIREDTGKKPSKICKMQI